MAHIVFIAVLDHGYQHDSEKRRQHSWLSIRDGDRLQRLQERNEHEVHIGCLLELLEQVEWDEVDGVICRGLHDVRLGLLSDFLEAGRIKFESPSPTNLVGTEPKTFLHSLEACSKGVRYSTHGVNQSINQFN